MLAACAALLSACSQSLPQDGLVASPVVTTNHVHTTRGNPQYLLCDRVDGRSASNFVTTAFGFAGALDFVDVELRGTRSATAGPVFRDRVDSDDVVVGRGRYAVTLVADATPRPGEAGKGSGLRADSIRIEDDLPGARKVTPEGDAVGAFRVYLRPTSTTGSGPGDFIRHAQLVRVYPNCRSQ